MTDRLDKAIPKSVIGLIPAAGQATRIAPIPCSRELYPIEFTYDAEGLPLRPKVVCQHVLEKMRRAGIDIAYVILRRGKFNIPAYLNDGQMVNVHLAGWTEDDAAFRVRFPRSCTLLVSSLIPFG